MHTGLQWYALEVASRKEKQVAKAVSDRGYECFLPLYVVRKVWSDRIKATAVPLFNGYVFSRFDALWRLPILVTPGVREIVGTGRIPTPIVERELEAIRAALRNGLPLEPCDRLEEGDRVLVTRGPLSGVEGTFVRHRGRDRLILSVALIERSVAVEIDRLCVEPISNRPALKERTSQLDTFPASSLTPERVRDRTRQSRQMENI